jgi:hypothetical protein
MPLLITCTLLTNNNFLFNATNSYDYFLCDINQLNLPTTYLVLLLSLYPLPGVKLLKQGLVLAIFTL